MSPDVLLSPAATCQQATKCCACCYHTRRPYSLSAVEDSDNPNKCALLSK
jgi:hypothetical protein